MTLRLAYRPPYDWPGMLAALSSRAAPGVEWIDDNTWHRRIDLDGKQGSVAVAHLPARNSVMVTIHFPCVKALPSIVARVRRVFDLGADIATIDSHLARDPKLAPLIRKRPGLRAPGDWERETMAVIAGQRAAGLAAVARLRPSTSQDGEPWLSPSPCWSIGCRPRSANC